MGTAEIRYLSQPEILQLAGTFRDDLEEIITSCRRISAQIVAAMPDLRLTPDESEHRESIRGIPDELLIPEDWQVILKDARREVANFGKLYLRSLDGALAYAKRNKQDLEKLLSQPKLEDADYVSLLLSMRLSRLSLEDTRGKMQQFADAYVHNVDILKHPEELPFDAIVFLERLEEIASRWSACNIDQNFYGRGAAAPNSQINSRRMSVASKLTGTGAVIAALAIPLAPDTTNKVIVGSASAILGTASVLSEKERRRQGAMAQLLKQLDADAKKGLSQ